MGVGDELAWHDFDEGFEALMGGGDEVGHKGWEYDEYGKSGFGGVDGVANMCGLYCVLFIQRNEPYRSKCQRADVGECGVRVFYSSTICS